MLDVGLGSGLNLAAALAWLEPFGVPLEAVSLELDPEGLRTALEWGDLVLREPRELTPVGPLLPDWRPWHAKIREALGPLLGPGGGDQGTALGALGGRLSVRWGDARDNLPHLLGGQPFDGVFLDPFAPAEEGDLWQPAFAQNLARVMAPGARLATYSSSLSVRASLAAAGLHVGRGARVGGKAQGTLASCGDPAQPWRDLEPRVAGKLRRRLERKIEGTANGE